MNDTVLSRYFNYSNWFIRATILLVMLANLALAGDKHCRYCGKLISGSYLQVHGYYYHPEHFLCAHCSKPIQGQFNKQGSKFYHPECYIQINGLVCGACGKVITGEYFEADGKKYHSDCYRENILPKCGWCGNSIDDKYFETDGKKYHEWCYHDHILPKCSICGEPLEGRYLEDAYGNKYHPRHSSEFPTCDNCGRIISNGTTQSGVTYPDGRHICTFCSQTAIKDIDSYYQSFHKVIRELGNLGFSVDLDQVDIKPVDRIQLKAIAGEDYTEQLRGYCNTRTQLLDGILSDRSHTIYILNDVPELSIESTMVHELMHIWIVQNTFINHEAMLEEGSCNYLSYLYLLGSRNSDGSHLIEQLLESRDPIYGDGFRLIKQRFGKRPLSDLFDHLKNHSTL